MATREGIRGFDCKEAVMAVLRDVYGIWVLEKFVKVKQGVYGRDRVHISREEVKADQSRLKNIIGVGVDVLGKARHTSSVPVMRSKDQIFERSGICGEPDFLSNKQLIRLKVGKCLILCRILDNVGDVSKDGKVLEASSCNPRTYELQREDEQSGMKWGVGKDDDVAFHRYDVAEVEASLWCNGNDNRRNFNGKIEEPDNSSIQDNFSLEIQDNGSIDNGSIQVNGGIDIGSIHDSNQAKCIENGNIHDNVVSGFSLEIQSDGADFYSVAEGRSGDATATALLIKNLDRGVKNIGGVGVVDASIISFNEHSVDLNGVILGYPGDPLNMVCASRGSGSIDNIVARKKVKVVSVAHDGGSCLNEAGNSRCSLRRSARIRDRKSRILGVRDFISWK
ncbi:hypothetical protein Dimus_011153 [Dionaea muscipula]